MPCPLSLSPFYRAIAPPHDETVTLSLDGDFDTRNPYPFGLDPVRFLLQRSTEQSKEYVLCSLL